MFDVCFDVNIFKALTSCTDCVEVGGVRNVASALEREMSSVRRGEEETRVNKHSLVKVPSQVCLVFGYVAYFVYLISYSCGVHYFRIDNT